MNGWMDGVGGLEIVSACWGRQIKLQIQPPNRHFPLIKDRLPRNICSSPIPGTYLINSPFNLLIILNGNLTWGTARRNSRTPCHFSCINFVIGYNTPVIRTAYVQIIDPRKPPIYHWFDPEVRFVRSFYNCCLRTRIQRQGN